jgi:hypothetical protein
LAFGSLSERLHGTVDRLDPQRIVIFGERHLRHVLLSYMGYHNGTRTHLSLNKDAPISRATEKRGTHYLSSDPGRTTPSIRPDVIYGRHSPSATARDLN